MSSDSGASSPGAHHHDHEHGLDYGETRHGLPSDLEAANEQTGTGEDDQVDEDTEDLASIDSGRNGFTFVTTKRSIAQQDEDETASALSAPKFLARPDSPASTLTPDDTPSIQVCRSA